MATSHIASEQFPERFYLLDEGSVIAHWSTHLRSMARRCAALMGGIATSPPFTWSATFAAQARLVIGKIKTDAKSNEITAISELLAFLDIKGCLVSIDAMGYQSAITSTIVKDGSNYLLVLKSSA